MNKTTTRTYAAPIWVASSLLVASSMIFLHLGVLPLMDPDEGRNATVSWEMQNSGHWLVPTYDSLPYLDKPFLFFRAVALSLSLFGHTAFAARLPSALAAAGILALIFFFARKEYGLRTACLSVIIVSTAPLFFAFSRIVIFDMLLTFFVCAAILSGYIAEEKEGASRRRWYILYSLMAGMATLVKGPVGFAVPILVLVAFNYFDHRKGAIGRLLSWKNFAVILALVLPWFIALSLRYHGFPYYGVVRETLLRFSTNSFHRSGPFYYYLPILFGTFLFWSILLPEMAVSLWKKRKKLSSPDRLLSVWFLVVIIFFSLSHSKLPGYILSAIIVLGVLTARLFDAGMRHSYDREKNIVRHGSIFLLCVGALISIVSGVIGIFPSVFSGLFSRIPNHAVVQCIHSVTLPVFLIFTAVSALIIASLYSRSTLAALWAFLLFPLALPFLEPEAAGTGAVRSDQAVAGQVAKWSSGCEVACYQCFPAGLVFYLRRPVTVFTQNDGSEIRSNYIGYYLSNTSRWPPDIKHAKSFDRWIRDCKNPVFVIVGSQKEPNWDLITGLHAKWNAHYLGNGYWGLLFKRKVVE